ncbi:MAG TPA: phosphoglycerate dehydrogenase [Pyrinomonadaceae bacterium]|nr:phosphoglycerate dehydrogenase [Pyrinomonadaceae bacterium]
MPWRVLVSAPKFLSVVEEFRSRLEAAGIEIVTVPVRERLNEAELLAVVETIDGVIAGDDEFTEKVLRAAPRLKVISKWGTGIDAIDTAAAVNLGIRVCNTPNAFTEAVADTTLGYILSFARGLHAMDRDVRGGVWTKPDLFSLKECTLGVVGVGNIGTAVVRRACAFGMKLVGADPVAPDSSFLLETGIVMMPLRHLLVKADFVSLHCDLNPTSFHLIGRAEFNAMKSSAYLINTARGPVVDETALVDALRAKRIAGAALDVFEIEPLPVDSPLREFSNCLLATHNAKQ